MADKSFTKGDQVTARTYVVRRSPELDGVTGEVVEVVTQDHRTDLTVKWAGQDGTRVHTPSHLTHLKAETAPKAPKAADASPKPEVAAKDQGSNGEGSEQPNEADPESTPVERSKRQRLIDHLSRPVNTTNHTQAWSWGTVRNLPLADLMEKHIRAHAEPGGANHELDA